MSAIRAVFVIGISAVLLLLVGPTMFQNPPWPYTGITVASNAAVQWKIVVRVVPGSPAYQAGMRTGDTVACMSLHDSGTIFGYYLPNAMYVPRPVHVCVQHDGAWHNVTFRPRRMPAPGILYVSPLLATLRLGVFAIFLFVGCALVIARPSLATWLLFAYCASNVPWAPSFGMYLWLQPAFYALLTTLVTFLMYAGPQALALFTILIPDARVPTGWRRTAFAVVALLGIVGVFVSVASMLDTSVFVPAYVWSQEVFTVATVLLTVARLADLRHAERARFAWAAFAIIFGIVCNLTRFLNGGPAYFVGSYLTVVMPLALMYAILRRHLIDVRFVLSRALVYAVLTTLVIGLIGVVDWATSVYLSQVRAALAIDAAVTIIVGFALHRSYRWIESSIDAILFREKHAAEEYLRRAARTLLRAADATVIDTVLAADPYEKLDLTMSALFRKRAGIYAMQAASNWETAQSTTFERRHDLVRFLETERARLSIGDLRKHVAAEFLEAGSVPAVAIPIFRGDDLFAFALYGFHRDGTRLDPDEFDALDHLCEAAAQAYMAVDLREYEGPSHAFPAMEPI